MPLRSCFGPRWKTASRPCRLYSTFAASLLLSGTPAGTALADFDREPYLARLLISLDRSSNYSDTAARQASVAFPGGSSDNPAAADWQPHPVVRPSASVTNIQAYSESGAWITATAGTMKVTLPDAGTGSVAYARTDTVDQQVRHGLSNDLSSDEYFVSYSRRFSETAAVGAEFRIANSMIKNQFLEANLGGMPLEARTKGRGVDGSFGLLLAPTPGWFAGVVAAFGLIDADIDIKNPLPLPVAPFATIPTGSTLNHISDDVRFFGIRGGLAYAPIDSKYVFCIDAQYLGVNTNVAGSTEVGRLAAGLDLPLGHSLIFHGGLGIDTQGEVTTSIGISYIGLNGVAIDAAYQYNAQPELRHEFGRFDLFSASINYRF